MILHRPQPAVKQEFRFSRWPVICLLLAVVTLAVWWPVVHCDFLDYDDPDYFTANPHVLAGLSWANIVWSFTTGHASNWHPLTWLSLMLDVDLFGKGAAGPHFTNLLLHTFNTVLLFLLLRRLTRLREDASARPAAATWRSALVAGLFALHPLHVESVAWVAERKDVLSACFGLLTLWAYARHGEKCKVQGASFKGFYWLALILFALGLMSKPMLVTLPVVMLLLDFWPLQRLGAPTLARVVVEKIPFFVLSAISCVVTFLVQQKSGAVAALVKLSVADRIGNALISYARYLGKTFWPATLATPYPLPAHWPILPVLLAFALFAGLCAAAIGVRKRFPFAFTGWFWFVIMLVPVIGLVQVGNAAMADRYTYLPLIGVFIVLVWGLGEVVARWHPPQPLVSVLILGLLLATAWRTRIQIGYWRNSGTLFTHTLAVTKNNYVAENDLGTWLSKNGHVREAIEHFQRSLQIESANPDARFNLNDVIASLQPANADALFNLGNAYAKLGEWNEAIANYRRALQVAPAKADVLSNMGLALASERKYDEAITNFEAALKLNPDSANTHNNLAAILFVEHRYDAAAQHYREALRLAPGDPRIYTNLGDTLVRLGQNTEAAKCYQEALRLDPGNASLEARLRALGAAAPQ